MSDYPIRPPTPQAMLHHLPSKPDLASEGSAKPSTYIILIVASTAVAGKVQIAKSVSEALSCPLFQGDSLHETAAKAASVGASRRPTGAAGDGQAAAASAPGPNEARYQRMWLSKMTRTGLLFPEESRPANEGFSGSSGASSTSTSRRGSTSSVASVSSSLDAGFSTSNFASADNPITTYINKPPLLALSKDEELRKANPALMVVTHPDLEQWHKDSIREAVGEYSIGVIFVPLSEVEELPVLKPLDPKTMTSFGSFGTARKPAGATLGEEIVLRVNVEAKVEALIEDIVDGVREIMNA
jgi:hypothetical protein